MVADAIQPRKPRARYPVGRDAKLLAGEPSLLSDSAVDRLAARYLGITPRQGSM